MNTDQTASRVSTILQQAGLTLEDVAPHLGAPSCGTTVAEAVAYARMQAKPNTRRTWSTYWTSSATDGACTPACCPGPSSSAATVRASSDHHPRPREALDQLSTEPVRVFVVRCDVTSVSLGG